MSTTHDYARYRAAHQRTSRRNQQATRRPPPPARRRRWPILVGGALCGVLSFAVTLQMIKPKPPSTAAAALARAFVSDSHSLIAAIRAAGLKGSPNVRGAIDALTALGKDRVSVTGWAGEVGNGGAPLEVLVFVDGENKLTLQTQGKHADVTGALGLSDAGNAHNVSFQGSLGCARGQKLIVVAVAESGDYGYFSPRICP
jgi:hypothetical protein